MRALPILLLLTPSVMIAACKPDAAEVVEVNGASASVRIALSPFRVSILDANRAVVLETNDAPGVTRDHGGDAINILPGWDGYVPDEAPWAHPSDARVVTQNASSASFVLDDDHGSIIVDVAIDGAKVTLTTTAHPTDADGWNKTALSFALRPDEHFFGLGERFASVDHRGLSLYSWAEEGGLGDGENQPFSDTSPYPNGPSMTYFPVPFVLSSAGYAMHLATTFRTETHLGSEVPDTWRVAVNDTALTTVVYVHDDPLASLDDYTRDTGRPLVPASWVFGPRRRVSDGQMALGVPEIDALRARKVPTTGVDDAVHVTPNRSELGNEAELMTWISSAHAKGYKVMDYNNPYVSMTIDAAKSDLDWASSHSFLALDADGSIGKAEFISGQTQEVATIDLTNPDAVGWFQDLLRRSLTLGYDGWMHDFGEYVRRPWKFADGRNGEAVHNEFPVLSAKAAHDLLVAERKDDFLFFVRSGYSGTQQYVPAVWGGDAEATFDETQGLPSVVRGGLNLGMSGVPYWGSDMTGFKCLTDAPRDKEVYLRWVEFGAMSPIMMEQNACSHPTGEPRTKWSLWNDDETIQVYAAMARLHTRLSPYFDILAREASAHGIPIMRHPFLYYPHEPEAWSDSDSFYLGPSLFTAPVVRRGITTRDVWLPPGRWVDIDDFTVYEGGAHAQVPAPLDKLPLFLKDGGIVPLLDPSIDTLAPATDPTVITPEQVKDRLDVIVALAPGSEARLVLADGTELTAKRARTSGPPSPLPQVSAEQVSTCDACVSTADQGMVSRVRLTSANDVVHEDLSLSVSQSPVARRIRWDVARLR